MRTGAARRDIAASAFIMSTQPRRTAVSLTRRNPASASMSRYAIDRLVLVPDDPAPGFLARLRDRIHACALPISTGEIRCRQNRALSKRREARRFP